MLCIDNDNPSLLILHILTLVDWGFLGIPYHSQENPSIRLIHIVDEAVTKNSLNSLMS